MTDANQTIKQLKAELEQVKQESNHNKLIFIGYTNPNQIYYAQAINVKNGMGGVSMNESI